MFLWPASVSVTDQLIKAINASRRLKFTIVTYKKIHAGEWTYGILVL